jgi:hypothetical protein
MLAYDILTYVRKEKNPLPLRGLPFGKGRVSEILMKSHKLTRITLPFIKGEWPKAEGIYLNISIKINIKYFQNCGR